jgi:hypothetical protein
VANSMESDTQAWNALRDALGASRSESLMEAAARVYSAPQSAEWGEQGDPLQAVAIAVLRSAGYSGLESFERLRRARELIPRPLRSV